MPYSKREWWQSVSIVSPFVQREVRHPPIGLQLHREALSLRLWMPFRVHTVLRVAEVGRIIACPPRSGTRNVRPTLNTGAYPAACHASYCSEYQEEVPSIKKCRVSALCFSKSTDESRTFAAWPQTSTIQPGLRIWFNSSSNASTKGNNSAQERRNVPLQVGDFRE